MAERRERGDGGLYWNEGRQRWVAEVTLGYDAKGKRKTAKRYRKTKTAARAVLRKLVQDLDDGLPVESHDYTVADAALYFVEFGLAGKSPKTKRGCKDIVDNHIVPGLGKRRLKDLSADDVDKWLAEEAKTKAKATLEKYMSVLRRIIKKAQARDKVRRNVALLCDIPDGQVGRPSDALKFEEAEAVLSAAEGTRLAAYIVVALLTGARTEELRALVRSEVELKGDTSVDPPIPPWLGVWRSVRVGGDTKTKKSRRTIALSVRCVDALCAHFTVQDKRRREAADRGYPWPDNGLVFCSEVGTPLDAANVRREFRKVIKKAGLNPSKWTPRELRHSFVSLLSDNDVPTERISQLVGHSSTRTTEGVYRKQIRPVITHGAQVMDGLFGTSRSEERSGP